MIELKNVCKIYKSKKGTSTNALNDINLKIGNKGMVFIVGKSGSGKSTLLNLIGGLDNLTSGDLIINGKSISNFSNKDYDSYRNTYIGFIFQEFNVLEQYNVYENIELAIKLQNHKVSRQKIDNLIDKLGIDNLGNRKINELSGGQKQRVAIARALIKNPQIILADEPTGNLDKKSSEQIFDILKDISKEQLVIIVSHDMESAQRYADRIIEIEDGKVISDSNTNYEIDNNSFELKKSKLPLSYALKMALTSFKTKPFRLFMTILLTTISLIFMGTTINCALFDKTRLVVNTMRDNDSYIYDAGYTYFGLMGSIEPLELTQNNIDKISDITKSKTNIVYSLYDNSNFLTFEYGNNDTSNNYYKYIPNPRFVEIIDSRILGDLIGKEPSSNNEIVVHKYFADYIIEFGIMTIDNELYFPSNYNEIINDKKQLKLGDNKVIITGIIDDDDSLFAKAKESGNFDSRVHENYFYNNYIYNSQYVYVKGFTDNVKLNKDKKSLLDYLYIIYNKSVDRSIFITENIKTIDEEIEYISNDGIKRISNIDRGSVILSLDTIRKIDTNFDSSFNKYIEKEYGSDYNELLENYIKIYLENNANRINLSINAHLLYEIQNSKLEFIGISLDDNNYISSDYIDEYNPVTKTIDRVIIYDNNINNLTNSLNKLQYIDFFEEDKNDAGNYYSYSVNVDRISELASVMNTYKYIGIYILVISLVFVLFAFLLFSNFISISISYCKKEIGILRALGATKTDVIKIFGYESIIIALISWILSSIGLIFVCNLLNKSIFGNLYFTLNGIIMHPLIPLIMIIYTILIAIIITSLSISRITNIKPIDAILNK